MPYNCSPSHRFVLPGVLFRFLVAAQDTDFYEQPAYETWLHWFRGAYDYVHTNVQRRGFADAMLKSLEPQDMEVDLCEGDVLL